MLFMSLVMWEVALKSNSHLDLRQGAVIDGSACNLGLGDGVN